MKYYKVYAQCVSISKPVIELTEKDVKSIIFEEANREEYGYNVKWNWVHEDPDDEDSDITQECYENFIDYVTDKLQKLLNELGYIDCSDYQIVKIDDDDYPSRPNCCYLSMASFFRNVKK